MRADWDMCCTFLPVIELREGQAPRQFVADWREALGSGLVQ